MGLAPMSVLPNYRGMGIGSELVMAGIEIQKARDCPFVIVLGHPKYYPRFGFKPAKNLGIECEWDVPDKAFMILLLDKHRMEGITGVARYRPEFGDPL